MPDKPSVTFELFGEPAKSAQIVAQSFEPARLTQARVLAGLSKGELAGKVGVSPAAIGQYEASVTSPRPEVLPRLARALSVDIEFFATGRPLARVDSPQAHFRSLRSARAGDRAFALATAAQIWELTCALQKRVQFPEVDLPIVDPAAGPRAAAAALRSHWDLQIGPIRHLTATAESRGLVVILRPTNSIDRVDAFSLIVADRPVIVTTPRRSDNVFRHRFTCAHEIGHILLHAEAQLSDSRQEHEADEFAAEFLTPANQIRQALPDRLHLPTLDHLSRTWGVPVESLIKRMGELGKTTDASVRRAFQRLNSTGHLRAEEPISAYRGEMPFILQEAQAVAEENGFSLGALAAELHWRPSRLRDLLGVRDTRPPLRLVDEPVG